MTFDALKFFGASPMSGVFFCNSQDAKLEPSKFNGHLHEMLSLQTTLYQVTERIDDLHLEVARLKRLFEKKLSQRIQGCEPLLLDVEKLPQVSVMFFPKVMNENLLYFLSLEKVYPSFAENNHLSLSELLITKGISEKKASSCLCFSLSHLLEEEDVIEAIERIERAYQKTLQFSQGLERS